MVINFEHQLSDNFKIWQWVGHGIDKTSQMGNAVALAFFKVAFFAVEWVTVKMDYENLVCPAPFSFRIVESFPAGVANCNVIKIKRNFRKCDEADFKICDLANSTRDTFIAYPRMTPLILVTLREFAVCFFVQIKVTLIDFGTRRCGIGAHFLVRKMREPQLELKLEQRLLLEDLNFFVAAWAVQDVLVTKRWMSRLKRHELVHQTRVQRRLKMFTPIRDPAKLEKFTV